MSLLLCHRSLYEPTLGTGCPAHSMQDDAIMPNSKEIYSAVLANTQRSRGIHKQKHRQHLVHALRWSKW